MSMCWRRSTHTMTQGPVVEQLMPLSGGKALGAAIEEFKKTAVY